ncbi:MAG: hypothetical protein ACREDF_09925 [Thermoplasmata archaeon]
MRVTVEVLPTRREEQVELGPTPTGLDLLRALRLAPDAHILVRRDVPIAADEPLMEGERIRVIAIVSGGTST